MTRPRVLVVADYYLPGFRAGGPVRAISNTIQQLGCDVDFFVATRDHDADGSKYHDVAAGRWIGSEAGRVRYAPRLTPALLQQCVRETSCDVVWLNSFFSRGSIGVLVLRRMGRIRQPVLLAPRGEFKSAALRSKPRRKAVVLRVLRWTGCLESVHWLASSEVEEAEIARVVGTQRVTRVTESVAEPEPRDQRSGRSERGLRAVFASRIAPTKNLLFLLEVLSRCDHDVHLDIIGPPEDVAYWQKCQALMRQLPSGVTVAYVGEIPHRDLQQRLSAYDVLMLPTLGESFGHIIVEAWAAGCPVLISDRTPWLGLRHQGVGWDVPLDHGKWVAAVAECHALGPETRREMRQHARQRARRVWEEGVAGAASLRELIGDVTQASRARRGPGAAPLAETASAGDTRPCV